MNDTLTKIKQKRLNLSLTQKEFADALGLGLNGDRQLRAWENGEHKISKTLLNKILEFPENPPFYQNPHSKYSFKFIDLFAGIGGIRLPFQEAGGFCAFTSEWDKFSQKTYRINFGHVPDGDITKIPSASIPDHDILLAGFPCQAFSQAGLRKGFEDTRGTLFFEIQKILVHKRPKAFLLENVKQLRGHDKGRTLKTIIDVLTGKADLSGLSANSVEMSKEAQKALKTKLNYWVSYKVISATQFGVPQNRQRIYIVGFDKDQFPKGFDFESHFSFPNPPPPKTVLGSILEKNKNVDPKYTLSDRLWNGHKKRRIEHGKKGNGFGYGLFTHQSPYSNTISARYYKDGSEILIDQSDIKANPRKLTPREAARLQGFPEEFLIPVSDCQAYKQYGNSVSVPVVRAVSLKILDVLYNAKLLKKKNIDIKLNKSRSLEATI